MLLLIFGISCILGAVYAYGKWKYGLFKRKGIPYVEPALPFLGSMMSIFFQREHLTEMTQNIYNQFPDEKYVGLFEGSLPLMLIKDLDLIKQIGVKDFDSFHDHRSYIDEKLDPLFGKILIALKGEKWRDMRATLSPAFTSSKMKNMFEFVEECAEQLVEHFLQKAKIPENNGQVEIEAKEMFQYYTNDVIATAVFGIKVNSIDEGDNTFYKMVKQTCNFSGVQLIKLLFFGYAPKLMKILNIHLIDPVLNKFFSDMVENTMKYRTENNIIRQDMIHLLMEAKKGSLKHENVTSDAGDFASVEESEIGKKDVQRTWDDNDINAQPLLFLVGGFETTSTALSFVIYELAKNPDIQQKLQKEIDESSKEGKLTYVDLPKLKYLDMVVSESLRLWPAAVMLDRLCSKSHTLPPPSDSNSNEYTINPNEMIWIPIYAIQRDAKYFPNPEKFDPERFSDENKSSILPNSYLPFGIGPRNCIGSRFALMTIKAIIYNLLLKFDIVVTSKTQIPIKLSKKNFSLHTEKGIWVALKPRSG